MNLKGYRRQKDGEREKSPGIKLREEYTGERREGKRRDMKGSRDNVIWR